MVRYSDAWDRKNNVPQLADQELVHGHGSLTLSPGATTTSHSSAFGRDSDRSVRRLGFADFPLRRGWASPDTTTKWYHCDAELAMSRAQSWLYFGLLQEFLGPGFDRAHFVTSQNATNDAYITTEKLPLLLSKMPGGFIMPLVRHASPSFVADYLVLPVFFGMFESLARRLRDGKPRLSPRVRNTLLIAQQQCDALDNHLADSSPVFLSIKALLWSLRNAASNQDIHILERDVLNLSPCRMLQVV